MKDLTLKGVAVKTAVVHTVTYFLVGLAAYSLFDYSRDFADPALKLFMRQTDDPLVRAGVLFQPIRGLLFGTVFFLLRNVFFAQKYGWLKMWISLVVIGILSTFAPATGSIEGLIYTQMKPGTMAGGMLEVLLQSFLLSVLTWLWVSRQPGRWFGRVAVILFSLSIIFPALGLMAAKLQY